MKPENWQHLSPEAKEVRARDLLNSERAHFLLNQALSIAAVVARYGGEESNAQDMEMLAETLFYFGQRPEESDTIHIEDLDRAA